MFSGSHVLSRNTTVNENLVDAGCLHPRVFVNCYRMYVSAQYVITIECNYGPLQHQRHVLNASCDTTCPVSDS